MPISNTIRTILLNINRANSHHIYLYVGEVYKIIYSQCNRRRMHNVFTLVRFAQKYNSHTYRDRRNNYCNKCVNVNSEVSNILCVYTAGSRAFIAGKAPNVN